MALAWPYKRPRSGNNSGITEIIRVSAIGNLWELAFFNFFNLVGNGKSEIFQPGGSDSFLGLSPGK